jgi:hypothetical protein
MHIWNSNTQDFDVKDGEFKASLGYTARPCLKTNK